MFDNCILFATFCSMGILVRNKKTWCYSTRKVMEFGHLMTDILVLVYVSCKFEMYIFKIAVVVRRKCTYCVSLCTEYIYFIFIFCIFALPDKCIHIFDALRFLMYNYFKICVSGEGGVKRSAMQFIE